MGGNRGGHSYVRIGAVLLTDSPCGLPVADTGLYGVSPLSSLIERARQSSGSMGGMVEDLLARSHSHPQGGCSFYDKVDPRAEGAHD